VRLGEVTRLVVFIVTNDGYLTHFTGCLSVIPVRDRYKRITTSLFEVGLVFGVYCLREWLLGTISRHAFRNIFFLLFALFLDLVRDADHCYFVCGRNLIYNCMGERC